MAAGFGWNDFLLFFTLIPSYNRNSIYKKLSNLCGLYPQGGYQNMQSHPPHPRSGHPARVTRHPASLQNNASPRSSMTDAPLNLW